MIRLVLILIFSTSIYAQHQITQKWLDTKPRSIAKDFYIWRYLNQDITPKQAIKALGQARTVNNKLFYRYAKKLKHKETSAVVWCQKLNVQSLVNQSSTCIELGMSTYKATKLSKKQKQIIINKLKTPYPKSAKKVEILNSANPFITLINSSNEVFFNTFNECGGKFRVNNFNHHLPKELIQRLKNSKIMQEQKYFAQTIKLIVTNPKLNKIQQSLLTLETTNLNHKSTFHLAINAIRHKEEKKALKFLQTSYKNGYFQQDKDKVLFWQYKLTKDKKYLDKLQSSWDNNIYSLLSFENINIKPKNIVYNIKNNNTKKSDYNYNNPFVWFPILRDTKKMNQNKMDKYNKLLNQKQTLGHLSFVKERFFRYKKSYFITPYKDTVGKFPLDRQALIYAIARQESRFIQTSISSAYAMGLMQIMPFLSKSIAKELKEFYDIDKQLEPNTNLKYANHHLNFLEKRLKHPLFIAYAYNGGIGFTKRLFKNGLFKNGKYEPFLSMEMLPYDETKKYGKKVLANYFIYKNHLDKNNHIKLSTLFKKIKLPLQN